MNSDIIIHKIELYAKEKLGNDITGHDYYHSDRVRNLAKKIASKEGANMFICEVAALVHDVIDYKFVKDQGTALRELLHFLKELGLEGNDIDQIIYIVTNISFNGGNNDPVETLEAQVVQDADRLEAIGAIGIARTMMFGGAKGRTLHIPNLEPRHKLTTEEYRNGMSTTINHFYEKLLKLKDLMNTETAKEIACKRHDFLVEYLDEFYMEWNGER